MKRSLLLLGSAALCLFIIIFWMISSQKQESVIEGRLVISENSLKETGSIRLDGEWEFYWDQLLAPGTFDNPEELKTGFMSVPGFWNYEKDPKYAAEGQATYRLIIDVTDDGDYQQTDQQALLIPRIFTQYRLWINGKIVSENGISDSNTLKYLTPSVVWIDPADGPVEVVLQVKNNLHIFGGIGHSILFGTASDLFQRRMLTIAFDFAFFALCIFSGLYHILNYICHRKQKASFWLASVCFLVGLRGLLTDGNFAMILWPDMPFLVGSRLMLLFIPCIAVAFIFYLRSLYARDIPQLLFRFLITVSVLHAILVVFLRAPLYLEAANIYLLFTAAISFLMLYLAVLSMVRQEHGAVIFTIGTVILVSCSLLDMLSYFRIISHDGYIMAGLSLFSLSQAIILALKYSSTQDESRRLHKHMKITDLNYLRAQIRPHFIFNALGTISSTISKDPNEGKRLLLDFSDFLHGCYSTYRDDGLTTLGSEIKTVQSYLSLEKARFRDRLSIEYDLKADESCLVPVFSIQPLVENAVLHGLMPKPGGGKLTISSWQEDEYTHISIEDDGVGIAVKESFADLDTQGNSIGISNINRRISILYNSSLQIESMTGKGTRIEMIIPTEE